MAEDKTINIDFKRNSAPVIPINEIDLQTGQNQNFINSKFLEIYKIKQHITSVPTYQPTNYYDQIVFLDNGTKSVYAFINGIWTPLGVGFQTVVGTGTSPASIGTQVITVGFRPKLIRITATVNTSSANAMSFGSATSFGTATAVGYTSYHYGSNAWMTQEPNDGYIINLKNTSGAYYIRANVSSIDDTSFTLNFDTTGATCAYSYEILG